MSVSKGDNLKFVNYFFIFLLCLNFFSCVSDSGIYSANVSDKTQLYFIRPTQINVKNQNLKTVDFDITLYVKDNELVGTPILNCTYYIPTQSSKNAEKFLLEITNDDTTLSVKNKKQLVKNIIKDKYLEIRYSYELNNDEILSLMQNEKTVKIKLLYPDGKFDYFATEELNKKLNDLRILML